MEWRGWCAAHPMPSNPGGGGAPRVVSFCPAAEIQRCERLSREPQLAIRRDLAVVPSACAADIRMYVRPELHVASDSLPYLAS